MKQKNFLKITLFSLLLSISHLSAQSTGDIAFVAFNADGDDDFAIVVLADLTANTKIWFTDAEPLSAATLTSGEGRVEWDTGSTTIEAGTIVLFNDFDAAGSRTASIGSFTDQSGTFALAIGGDAIFAYTGTATSVTTWLAGIQNKTDNEGANLADSGLTAGTTFINFYTSGSPDGGVYTGSRNSETSYSDYLAELGNNTNWDSTTGNTNGELILPLTQEAFTISSTTWDGSTDEDWSDGDNWSNGVPTIDSNVSIPNTSNSPEIKSGTNAFAGNITINADASLEVTQAVSYTHLTLPTIYSV